MTDPLTRLLSVALYRMILVGAMLVAMKLIVDGVYAPALVLVITLGMFAFIRFSDSRLLR